jgi:hypothetical protein
VKLVGVFKELVEMMPRIAKPGGTRDDRNTGWNARGGAIVITAVEVDVAPRKAAWQKLAPSSSTLAGLMSANRGCASRGAPFGRSRARAKAFSRS